MDEREADAISSTLFKLILKWAVEEGNVFVWCFCLLMWHLMARSINVDSIALHCIKRGISDSITFKYDETKMDKTGEFVQEKNCYSNPHEPLYCVFTALGCYLSINAEALENNEKLFVSPGSKYRTAAQNFARHVHEMGTRHAETIKNYVRLSHFNIHGVRKGSGTHAASATTCPPLFTSIACRGEWSMGKILDIYFRFAAGGDYYLGQLLTLKDPMTAEFNTPCPHWKEPDDPLVLEGIRVTFGKILLSHEDTDHDPQGILSLLLASIVYHSDWILKICQENPSHPFNSIPLLSSPLLLELKENCLTMELNNHVPIVTGIPPHVEHLCRIKELKDVSVSLKEDVMEFRQCLEECVGEAIDKKLEVDGGINASILDKRLKNMENLLLQRINQVSGCTPPPMQPVLHDGEIDLDVRGQLFLIEGKFYCVPPNFASPAETTRLNGWRMWLMGKTVVYNNKTFKTKPFHMMKGTDLPKSLRAEFDTKWKPIFKKMMEAPGLIVPDVVDEAFVQSSFVAATEYLKSTVSYIWKKAKDEGQLSKYSIGTWSRKVARSEIMKWGMEDDKAKLPPSTAYNKADNRKRGGWHVKSNRVRRVPMNKRRRVAIVEEDRVQEEFAGAFGGVDVHGNSNVVTGGVEGHETLDVGALAGTSLGGAVLQS